MVILFIRSPWGQDIIIQRFLSSIEEKTGATVNVEKAFISFSGDLVVKGLYVEDLTGDTLVYSESLEAEVPLWPYINGGGLSVNSLEWSGVTANIIRRDSLGGFNYEFLLSALPFSSADTTAVKTTAPDTATTKINLGNFHLANFDVDYIDEVSGINSSVNFEQLELKMEDFNAEKMFFHVGNAGITNAKISYLQTKPFPETEDSIDPAMPSVILDELKLNNVEIDYESLPDGIIARVGLDQFLLKLPKANLATKTIVVDRLAMLNSEVFLKTEERSPKDQNLSPEEQNNSFQWPDWEISVQDVLFENNKITYLSNGQMPQEGQFNPGAFAINNLDLKLPFLSFQNKQAEVEIEEFDFSTKSGLNLKELTFTATMDPDKVEVNDLYFHLNDNLLVGEFILDYDSVEDLIETPEDTHVEARLAEVKIDFNDLFTLQPDLRQNEMLRKLAQHDISGSVRLSGTLANLQLRGVNLNWGDTRITGMGNVQNLMDPENIQFNFSNISLEAGREDLLQFFDEEALGISIPENIKIEGNFSGSPQDLTADANLILPEGEISIDGSFNTENGIAFNTDLQISTLNLRKLLQNKQLGQLSLALTAEGEGANLTTLDAVLDAEISLFEFNGYAYKGININGEIENGSGPVYFDYKDNNLNMEMIARIDLDTVFPAAEIALNLIAADLQGLGITKRSIKTAFDLEAFFEGNLDIYDLSAEMTEAIMVYDDENYLIGDLALAAHVTPDTTAVLVENKVLDLALQSNSSPAGFFDALQQHFYSYYSEEIEIPDTIIRPVNLELNAQVRQAPILADIFLPDLKRLDTVEVSVNFNQKERVLDAYVSLPFINYNDYEVDSLLFSVTSDKDNLETKLSFDAINAGPLALNKTNLAGNIVNDRLFIDFESFKNDSLLVNIQSVLNAENDSLYFHIDPSELILNGNEWNIPEDNIMVFAEKYLGIDGFRLHRENRELRINSPGDDPEKEKMTIAVNNFPLESLIGFLNPEKNIATGNLNGDLIFEEIYGKTGILADLEIAEFHVMSVPLGRLSFDAEALSNNTYKFDLALNDGDIDLDLTGNYLANESAAKLNLDLDINQLDLDAINKFTSGAITNTSGYLSGNFEVKGTTADPVYEGILEFHDTEFSIAALSAPFAISGEQIRIDTTAVYFGDFRIEDENSSGLILNGEVITKSLMNPGFDLNIEANNFKLLDATAEENELVYGQAVVDVDASVAGDLNLPVINMDINVHPETNLTYALPGSELEVVERDGIVRFVNRENPNDILTRTEGEEDVATVQGIILNANIDISDNSAFTLIIDRNDGDNLKVMGEGNLIFSISETGRTTLAGRYELTGGHYEMNLYGLVNRTFEIVPGSTISWFGDPLDASLDISAIYRVETSASSLMATLTSGADANIKSRFRQVLPFLVYLNVDGRLMQPKLTFGIDMPEEEQGSLGGQVYARIQQLNELENELNKQVFSLLVLNRFYPQSNTYGGEGGVVNIARDNLNQAISDQLDAFSGDLLEDTGIALNFGLNSYTDYQGESPQERTALEIAAVKKFYGGRLIVEVGSEVNLQGSDPSAVRSSPLIGNVSIQYLLTENGKFRLKGFRRNTFENIIDGQVIITGIALIFMQQFNDFAELWTNPFAKSSENTKEEKAKEPEGEPKPEEEPTDESKKEEK